MSFRILLDTNDLVIIPPLAGRSPVSLSMAFVPLMVALMEIARPPKVFGVSVGGGVGVGVATGVGVGVGVATGVGVGVATGVGVGVVPPQVVVVTVSDHPPLKVPTSIAKSSTIYSEYVPFGAAPLKTASVEPYGPPGAGAGNVSPVPKLVGW